MNMANKKDKALKNDSKCFVYNIPGMNDVYIK